MEAKASRNPGAITPRRVSLRERISAFLPHMDSGTNGRAAVINGKVTGDDAGSRLEGYLRGSRTVVFHHLNLPGASREIDHLVVGPACITVVDSRHYCGGKAKFENGQLRIGHRNRSDMIPEVLRQADAVRQLLADTPYAGVPVESAIAVSKAGGIPTINFQNGRSVIVWGTGLIAREASRPGRLSRERIDALASYLAGRQ